MLLQYSHKKQKPICCSYGTTKRNRSTRRHGNTKVVLVGSHLLQNSTKQDAHLTRCPPPSGTIQLPHSGLTNGIAPVAFSPLRVSRLRHVSKARLSSSDTPVVSPPSLPPALAEE